jgi:hypothetical protein
MGFFTSGRAWRRSPGKTPGATSRRALTIVSDGASQRHALAFSPHPLSSSLIRHLCRGSRRSESSLPSRHRVHQPRRPDLACPCPEPSDLLADGRHVVRAAPALGSQEGFAPPAPFGPTAPFPELALPTAPFRVSRIYGKQVFSRCASSRARGLQ